MDSFLLPAFAILGRFGKRAFSFPGSWSPASLAPAVCVCASANPGAFSTQSTSSSYQFAVVVFRHQFTFVVRIRLRLTDSVFGNGWRQRHQKASQRRAARAPHGAHTGHLQMYVPVAGADALHVPAPQGPR